MQITDIILNTNRKLAGENLSYSELEVHLDAAIDAINAQLNSLFPSFSEFRALDENDAPVYENYPNYNFFPDRYIRTAVVAGAAYNWFVTDEEGIATATTYELDFRNALFIMLRDYSPQIPEEFRSRNSGFVQQTSFNPGISYNDPMNNVRVSNQAPSSQTGPIVYKNPYGIPEN